jgi:dienelactone hydrolase
MMRHLTVLLFLAWLCPLWAAAQSLENTKPLTIEGDLASHMVAGIDKFLLRELQRSIEARKVFWDRDTSSADAYNKSVAQNRERLKKIIGIVASDWFCPMHPTIVRDNPQKCPICGMPLSKRERTPFTDLEVVTTLRNRTSRIALSQDFEVLAVRWPVLKGVSGEGLLLLPRGLRPALGDCVAIPDADQTPEMLAGLVECPENVQFAKRLAESGCRVLIPTLISRSDKYSAAAGGERKTNQTHREFVYRPAFEMGRHIIGYEVQKVLAAVDFFHTEPRGGRATGVIGYGEGGLVALYTAALDPRITACCVSGYFDSRQDVWQEPIYRNVFGLLHEFGDAELASLVAPRALVVEACAVPKINNVPPVREGRPGTTAAPGQWMTPPPERVQKEFERAKQLVNGLKVAAEWQLITSSDGGGPSTTDKTLAAFLKSMVPGWELRPPQGTPTAASKEFDFDGRQKRQLDQLLEHTQQLMRESEYVRRAAFKNVNYTSLDAYQKSTKAYREHFYNEVIGRFDIPLAAANPRTRKIYDEPAYTGHEVLLDVFPDVIAYGILLLPKDIKPGERRPVVVCQHGLEGRPQDVADAKVDNPAYHMYAAKLAERGFITYSPQNPYIFWDRFRTLQRKANPLKKTLFSIIVPQHQQTVRWLASLPMVDAKRIGFYGLSYGGKTAMRVPAIVEEYALSICSADFNEWIWKNASLRSTYSYVGTAEYEIFEFDLGHTYNYAEMAALIAPRPFMVERGHRDGVAPDEQVAYEYAKVRRLYADLKIPDRTTIEFFDGPHTIHGVGTFEFLHKHLGWGKR